MDLTSIDCTDYLARIEDTKSLEIFKNTLERNFHESWTSKLKKISTSSVEYRGSFIGFLSSLLDIFQPLIERSKEFVEEKEESLKKSFEQVAKDAEKYIPEYIEFYKGLGADEETPEGLKELLEDMRSAPILVDELGKVNREILESLKLSLAQITNTFVQKIKPTIEQVQQQYRQYKLWRVLWRVAKVGLLILEFNVFVVVLSALIEPLIEAILQVPLEVLIARLNLDTRVLVAARLILAAGIVWIIESLWLGPHFDRFSCKRLKPIAKKMCAQLKDLNEELENLQNKLKQEKAFFDIYKQMLQPSTRPKATV